ncbi:MAG: LytTR family DNA-binding domain-containing protein [Niabella sp.]
MGSEKIHLSEQRTIYLVKPEEIVFCQSDDCYTNVYLVKDKKILIVKSLTKFQKELCPKEFIRVSQSYLVNRHYIKSIDKKKRLLALETNHIIPFTISLKSLLSIV